MNCLNETNISIFPYFSTTKKYVMRLPKLYINNTETKREISIKYLGVDNLTWKPCIEKIKSSKNIVIMYVKLKIF